MNELPQNVQKALDALPDDDPIRQLRQRKSKIAIVGFTEHRKNALDLDPDEWALWGLNELYRYCPLDRFDLWCEIHDWKVLSSETQDEVPPPWPRHVEVLTEGFDGHPATKGGFSVPVYMQQKRPDVPNSYALPKALVEGDLPDSFGEYKTSAPAWMLGLAIYAGFEEIHLYGIDMATNCLAHGNRVLTEGLQWRPVEDVRVGDTLLAFDEEPVSYNENKDVPYRRWKKSKVLASEQHLQPCYRVTLENGDEVIASEEHGWLVSTSGTHVWRYTKDLVNGPERGRGGHNYKRRSQATKVIDTWDDTWTRESGYLAAAFDGEGTVGNPSNRGGIGIGMGQRVNAMLATVKEYLDGFGFAYSEKECRSRDQGGVKTKTKINSIGLLGGLPEKLRFLGQIRPHRLLEKLGGKRDFGMLRAKEHVGVVSAEYIGKHPVVGLQTETHTIIAEGYAMHNTEYAQQRPCMEFLLGVAAGRGINISVPDTSDLLHSVGQYAFGAGNVFTQKLVEREGWLTEQLEQHQGLRQELNKVYGEKRKELKAKETELEEMFRIEASRVEGKVHEIIGQLQNVQYIKRSWAVPAAQGVKGPHPDRSKDAGTGIKPGDALANTNNGGGVAVAPQSKGTGRSTEAGAAMQPMTATPNLVVDEPN